MATRQNTIKVSLDIKDIYRELSRLERESNSILSKLQRQIERTFGVQSGGSGFSTAAWISAFGLIERAGTAAFAGISNQIKVAANFQKEMIQSAGGYQALLRVSFQEGERIAKLVDRSFSQASIGLPDREFGQTLKNAIGDDILQVFYDKNNLQGSADRTANIIARLQALAAPGTGVNQSQATSLILDAMTGKYSTISQSEAFRKNPQFARAFDEIIASVGGVKEFDKLSKSDRIKKVIEPLAYKLSDDTLNAYRNSLTGMWSKMSHTLFDNQTGLFSFSRELTGERTSIIDVISLQLTELGEVSAKYSPKLREFANSIMGNLSEFLTALGGLGITIVNTFPIIIPLIHGFTDSIQDFITTTVKIADSILKPIGILATNLGFAEKGIYSLGYALGTLAAIVVSVKAIAFTGGILGNAAIGGLSAVLSIPGILKSLLAFAIRLAPVFSLVGVAIKGAFVFLLTNPIGLTITAIAAGAFLIYRNWDTLKPFFKGLWEGIVEGAKPVTDTIVTISSWAVKLGNSFAYAVSEIGKLISKASQLTNIKLPNLPNLPSFNQQGTGKAIGKSLMTGVLGGFIPSLNLGRIFGFADGNDPYGVFSAITGEQMKMPAGARLAIANTDEMILNRQQQTKLSQSMGKTIHISPTINITGVSNPEIVADIVIEKLNTLFQQAKLSY